jgi:hypothetical protein
MGDQLLMFDLQTLEVLPSAIFSPASAAGVSRSNSPAGPQIGPFGPALAPASPIPSPEEDSAPATPATSGPSSLPSSASAALCASLGSRLQEQLAGAGSMEYGQTWREQTTPAGLRYWEHTARAPLKDASGYTGWATPCARDYRTPNKRPYRERGGKAKGEQLANQAAHHGPIAAPSSAATVDLDGYRLNPWFVGWLMGYPEIWAALIHG